MPLKSDKPVAGSGQSGAAEPAVAGFRNFLGSSNEFVPFKIGRDLVPRENMARLRELMQRLSRRMTTRIAGVVERDNPAIPAGYTYFLQFVAHDLVATSIPFWALVDDPSLGIRNERTSRLRLDTIYGGGPAFNPSAYAPDDEVDTSRTRLRLGRIAKNLPAPAVCPFRDIARAAVSGANGPELEGLSEALIADPRNDQHVIISQFTVLFHALHNAIVEMLPADDPALLSAHKRFACARDATTVIYRNIVRNELLPKVLHEAVRGYYNAVPRQPFFDAEFAKEPSGPLPLEFSHGAFRFGHAMVRDEYNINGDPFSVPQLLKQTSAHSPDRMPLDARWIVNWSHFFSLDGNMPANLSRRLSPSIGPLLMDSQLFGPIDESNWHGLPYRDLMSAALAGVWSVPNLIEKIEAKNKALVQNSLALKNSAWKQGLKDWLGQAATVSGLDPADIDDLVENPPLPLFVLFEAQMETEGKSLGILGSIIVADVLYALLEEEPFPVKRGFDLEQALTQISKEIYGVNRLEKELFDIASMADLIKFVAKRNGWELSQPFI
jgi:hypothetical protein